MNNLDSNPFQGFDYPKGISELFMVDDVVINAYTYVTACHPKLLLDTYWTNVDFNSWDDYLDAMAAIKNYASDDNLHICHQDVSVSWEVRFSTHLFSSDLLAYGDLKTITAGDYRGRRPHSGKCFYPRDGSCWKCDSDYPVNSGDEV
jgi:hypothetical protein